MSQMVQVVSMLAEPMMFMLTGFQSKLLIGEHEPGVFVVDSAP